MNAPWLVKPPPTPSQWDDEFEATSLASKWTPFGTWTQTLPLDPYFITSDSIYRYNIHSERKSWLMVQPAIPQAFEGLTQSLVGLPTNCFLLARVSVNVRSTTITDGDGEFFLRVFNGAAGAGPNSMLLGFDTFGSILEGFLRETFNSVGTNLGLVRTYFNDPFPLEYVGLQKIGSTWHGWVGTASGHWVWLGSRVFASDNFDTVILAFNNQVVTSPGRMLVGCDYFRVISGKGPP